MRFYIYVYVRTCYILSTYNPGQFSSPEPTPASGGDSGNGNDAYCCYVCIHMYIQPYLCNCVYSVSHQLSIISTHSQLSMEQKWCIFKQAR